MGIDVLNVNAIRLGKQMSINTNARTADIKLR